MPYQLPEIIAELAAEQKERLRVYPRQIKSGKLTSEKANLQYARLQSVIFYLQGNDSVESIQNCIAELARELAMRKAVYTRQLNDGKISAAIMAKKLGLVSEAIELMKQKLPAKPSNNQASLF